MKALPLNEKALLYDGCRLATLESPTFTRKPKTPTQREGDSSELVANTEFVSIVEAKLNKRIDDLTEYVKSEVKRLDGLIDACEARLDTAENNIRTLQSNVNSLQSSVSSLQSRVGQLESAAMATSESLDQLDEFLRDS